MYNPIPASISVSASIYEHLVGWRNEELKDGKPVEFLDYGELSTFRKIVAEAAFIPLALLGAIEAVARGILSIVSVPLVLFFGNDINKDSPNIFNHFATATFVGGAESLAVVIGSGIGLAQNFREDELTDSAHTISTTHLCCCWANWQAIN